MVLQNVNGLQLELLTSDVARFGHHRQRSVIRAAVVVVVLTGPCIGQLSAQGRAGEAATIALPAPDDKTVTNPLNIQSAIVARNDFARLPDELFRSQTLYRHIIALRHRTMSGWFEVPLVASNVTGRTEFALGDVSTGWSWIPWLARSSGILIGVDAEWNTSTNAALGTGRPTIAPFLQYVVFPSRALILAAAYQQRQSAGGDEERAEVSKGAATLYLAWRPTPGTWISTEPQLILDYERNLTGGRIDAEWGQMIRTGIGAYVRPGIGLGAIRTRPFEWTLEIGVRVVS